MKKIKNSLPFALAIIIGLSLAFLLVEYQEARNEAMHRRLMCASVDMRLVKGGLGDCAGVETSVYK